MGEYYDTRTCEVCGKRFITGYGYSLGLCWLVTGHANIASFMCPEKKGNQHWGCSPEHAIEAALSCVKDHMTPLLQKKYADAKELGLSRVADDDADTLDERDDQFHIIK